MHYNRITRGSVSSPHVCAELSTAIGSVINHGLRRIYTAVDGSTVRNSAAFQVADYWKLLVSLEGERCHRFVDSQALFRASLGERDALIVKPSAWLETWYDQFNQTISINISRVDIRVLYLVHVPSIAKPKARHAVPHLVINEQIDAGTPETIKNPFNLLTTLWYRDHPEGEEYWRSLTTLSLFLTIDVLEAIAAANEGVRTSKAEWTWKRVKDYIRENYPFDIPRSVAAKDLELHPSHLSRLCRDRGTTYSAFVNGYRLEKAKELLVSSPELTVSEIAGRTGFNSVSYLFRLFRAETGLSLQEYRSVRRAWRT